MIGGQNREKMQFQKGSRVECTVNQELVWLWHGDSSGTQEGERPQLEAGKEDWRRTVDWGNSVCVFSELENVKISDSTRL
jgi:hypothetical protein